MFADWTTTGWKKVLSVETKYAGTEVRFRGPTKIFFLKCGKDEVTEMSNQLLALTLKLKKEVQVTMELWKSPTDWRDIESLGLTCHSRRKNESITRSKHSKELYYFQNK